MKRMQATICMILVLCYAAGLVSMLFFSFGLGLMLWVISTLGGGCVLYRLRRNRHNEEDAGDPEDH